MQLPVEQLVGLLLKEIKLHKLKIAIAFSAISLTILGLGVTWPNRYTAFTNILVEEQVLDPDTARAVHAAGIQRDQVGMARELVFSQKIMDEVLRAAKLINDNTTPLERERIIDSVKNRTEFSRGNPTLLKIQYTSTNPQEAFLITKNIGEVFVRESTEDTQRKAVEEFNFYENQVREYSKKLVESEQKRNDISKDNISATPGNEADVNSRINALRLRIEQSQLELKETEIRKKTVQDQLSGEAEITIALSREGQYRQRIAELQQELETLRLSYHDTYPDIVRIKHQIVDLKESITAERRKVEAAKNTEQKGTTRIDEGMALSPLYQQLKNELSQTKTLIATLNTRITENQNLLNKELERARRIHDVEVKLADITRDYGANRTHYENLLRNRDNAKDAMNKLLSRKGATLIIKEPATLPQKPSGLQFMHFLLGGIALGLLLPLSVVYVMIIVDPRIRSAAIITEQFKLPVLAAIPWLNSPEEKVLLLKHNRIVALIFSGVIVIYIVVAILKLNKVI
jgi:polysaccharide chain length determinant protein (PEP-CTERM system associated)